MDNDRTKHRKMIKNIIFDFDGTLADTTNLIVSTMQETVKQMNLPYRSSREIRATIGVRLTEIPSILWPSIKNIGEIFAENYRRIFSIFKDKIPVYLYPGVKETLMDLKSRGLSLAIATSRSHHSVEELTTQLGIRDCFNYIIGGDDVSKGKPNPESIFLIMKKGGWNSDSTMMTGDMKVDIEMGKSADCVTCGVVYGNGLESELTEAGADFIVHDFRSLVEIVDRLSNY